MFLWIIKKVFRFFFWLRGWKFVTEFDFGKNPKFILVAGGHTSNWDFVYALGCFEHLNRNISFTIKKEWLRFPFKTLMTSLGAIGIDRARKNGERQTDIMAKLFQEREELCLLVTAEGTRKKVEKWKSGFFYIAEAAGVPVVPGHLDYKNKVSHIGKAIDTSQGYEATMKEIMNYYKEINPCRPEKFELDQRFV